MNIDERINKFAKIYKDILESSLGDGSPYCKLEQTLEKQYDQMDITAEKKALFIAQSLTALSANLISSSQQSAIELILKSEQIENQIELSKLQIQKTQQEIEKLLPLQIENTKAQGKLTKAQEEKTKAQKELVEAQKTSIEEQTIDNRKIKAIEVLGDTFGRQAATGLTVNSAMWSTFFGLINDLVTISIPASTTITKVKSE